MYTYTLKSMFICLKQIPVRNYFYLVRHLWRPLCRAGGWAACLQYKWGTSRIKG